MDGFVGLLLSVTSISCACIWGWFILFFTSTFLKVERDEFSGVCIAGNLSTTSMIANIGFSIFFVLLVACRGALSAFASSKFLLVNKVVLMALSNII